MRPLNSPQLAGEWGAVAEGVDAVQPEHLELIATPEYLGCRCAFLHHMVPLSVYGVRRLPGRADGRVLRDSSRPPP